MRGNADGLTKRQRLPAATVLRSRLLRKQAGEPERRLWQALRRTSASAKFRRQVAMGCYHVDFCSHAARLIVEVDGDDHAQRVVPDAQRTHFLNDEGYRVIRFANMDVMHNIDGVLASIAAAIAAQKTKGRP